MDIFPDPEWPQKATISIKYRLITSLRTLWKIQTAQKREVNYHSLFMEDLKATVGDQNE